MKGRTERLNMMLSASKEEIGKILDHIIMHAKTPECRREMMRAQAKLESTEAASMIEALELDTQIKNILHSYSMEFLNEKNNMIDEGTGIMISAIIDERSKMFCSGIETDRRLSCKKFKQTYKKVMDRKTLKEKFEKQYANDLSTVDTYKKSIDKLGRSVVSYNLNCRLIREQAELAQINERIQQLIELFEQSKDGAQRMRLENEYQALEDSKQAIDLNLRILQENIKNIAGYEDLLRGTHILGKLKLINVVSKDDIISEAQKLQAGLKAEKQKQNEINTELEKVSQIRNRTMNDMAMGSRTNAARPSLAQISQDRMNRSLDAVNAATVGGANANKAPVIKTKLPKLEEQEQVEPLSKKGD